MAGLAPAEEPVAPFIETAHASLVPGSGWSTQTVMLNVFPLPAILVKHLL